MSAPDICLIILPGSEFAMKAMASLTIAQSKLPAPFTTRSVNIMKLKKILAAPHQVPVLSVDEIVVSDSTDILKFLDAKYGTAFFPAGDLGAKVAQIEDESDVILGAYLRYFALYDNEGFSRCIKKQILKAAGCFGHIVVLLLWKTRASRKKVLKDAVPGLNVESRGAVLAGLNKLLQQYNDMLGEGDAGYLCGTPEPSAADCAVYAMLTRFVSTSGDSGFDPCLPGALDGLPRLAKWLARMERDVPISFKNNKRPGGMKRPAALIADP